jgi:perosamine synthetase
MKGGLMIPVFKPCYGNEELEALKESFQTGWLGLGPKTKLFEEKFARYINVKFAIGVDSATSALNLAFKLANIKNKEVITTSMTFVSTNHAILYNDGIPVFADIEQDTLNIDADDIENKISSKTKAIVVVHYGGHACNMDKIINIAKNNNLILIEDCAHACGGFYKGKSLGSLGDHGCFSFHAVKNLATGDGGMITTNDPELDKRLRKLRWLGISKGTWDRSNREEYSWEYDVEELGYKCHMNDITASIGMVQLGKLEEMNNRRRYLAERYTKLLSDMDWIDLPVEKEYAKSAWHNYVIKVKEKSDRNPLIDFLKTKGISTGMHYIPNHLYEIYQPYVKEELAVTERIWKKLITLPLFPDLSEDQQDMIVREIYNFKKLERS